MSKSVLKIDDNQLAVLIRSTEYRLVFLSPGTSSRVADAICERWTTLGKDAVNIILDIDPEICRMGYGEIEALQHLEATARQMETMVHHQPGIRLGIIIADDTILVFAPTPLLIEGGSTQRIQTNAIQLDSVPISIAKELGLGVRGVLDQALGLDKVPSNKIQEVANDLKINPPVKFDVAQKVRVFNARFEFVEFELKGCSISRKTVPIPPDLIGLANDERTQRLLRSSFRLVDESNEISLSGENIYEHKQQIVNKYLIHLKGYGTVVLRSNKDNLIAEVNQLRKEVSIFQKKVESHLQKAIDENRASLVNALAPAVINNPPDRWIRYIGHDPTHGLIRRQLEEDLKKAFGDASNIVTQMKVSLVFKGVTYESLNEPNFIEIVQSAIPSLRVLHEEYDAAKASEEHRT